MHAEVALLSREHDSPHAEFHRASHQHACSCPQHITCAYNSDASNYPKRTPNFHPSCHRAALGCSAILHGRHPAGRCLEQWGWHLPQRRQHCKLPGSSVARRGDP